MLDHSTALPEAIQRAAVALKPAAPDYDPLLQWIGDARLVLLGEASHGTHEFYRERAHITQRLIAEKHFTAVAVEADWPDAYRVNRYVGGNSPDADAEGALRGFKRFPTWMWRNADVLDFVGWLRAYNDALPAAETRVGFYGLDLYSLSSSIEAVIRYLDKIDPQAARRARQRYSCFEDFTQDTQAYGYAATVGLIEPCENDVVAQLVELRRRASEYAQRDGRVAEEEFFYAEQNARLAKNAEEYYRAMFRGRVSSWNLRDRHMVETLSALLTYLERRTTPVKVVVWAHNSHLGDARATEMSEHGELNVGQLVRERFGFESRLIGFTTHAGSVTAASDWDAPAERKLVRPALPGSIERIFHDTGVSQFVFNLRGAVPEGLKARRLERAIGVIYRPDTERASHYFHARLPEQFDAVIHIDHTCAVEPLERSAVWHDGEPAETYPSGL